MTNRVVSRWSGLVGLAGCVVCWGTVPVILRHLTGSIDSWTANAIRYPLAAMLYWPFLVVAIRQGAIQPRHVWVCLLPAAFSLGGQILWAMAPYYLPASTIGFLVRLTMVWSTLTAMILFQEERRLLARPSFYLGMLLMVTGYLLLAALRGVFDTSASPHGALIMLFCSLFFGLYAVSVRRLLQQISPLYAFGIVAQFVSIATFSAMFIWGDPGRIDNLSSGDWVLLVSSSVLGIALGHFFLYSAVRRLGPTLTTSIQTVTPFVTAVIAYATLHETMTLAEVGAGMVMTLGAIFLLRSGSPPRALEMTPPVQGTVR